MKVVTLKGDEEVQVDTKMLAKEEVTKKLHKLGELRRTTTKVFKGRDLKVFATIAGKMSLSPRI